MPDRENSNPKSATSRPENAFHPEFLARLDRRDDPPSAAEAAHGGVWRVARETDGRYGLYRHWQGPETGDEPFAVLDERPLALLAAAFLPLLARGQTVWSQATDTGHLLYRGDRAVGRLRYTEPDLTEALNLAEGLARSPASIAAMLEAAGSAALGPAGEILARQARDRDA